MSAPLTFTLGELAKLRADLRGWIETLTTAYREADGAVRDPKVRKEIERLHFALRLLRKRNFRPGLIRHSPLGNRNSPS